MEVKSTKETACRRLTPPRRFIVPIQHFSTKLMQAASLILMITSSTLSLTVLQLCPLVFIFSLLFSPGASLSLFRSAKQHTIIAHNCNFWQPELHCKLWTPRIHVRDSLQLNPLSMSSCHLYPAGIRSQRMQVLFLQLIHLYTHADHQTSTFNHCM